MAAEGSQQELDDFGVTAVAAEDVEQDILARVCACSKRSLYCMHLRIPLSTLAGWRLTGVLPAMNTGRACCAHWRRAAADQ